MVSEEGLERLLEASSQIPFEFAFQPELSIKYMGRLASTLLGHDPEDYYRDPQIFFSQVYPRDRPSLEKSLEFVSDGPSCLPVRIVRPDGNLVWFEVTLLPKHDGDDQVVDVQGILKDITDIKLLEEEQRDLIHLTAVEKEWVQTVLAKSPVAMMLVRKHGARTFYQANQRFHELTGTEPDRERTSTPLLGRLLDDAGAELAEDHMPSVRVFRGDNIRDQEFVIRTVKGDVPVRINAAPIRGPRGRLQGAVVAIEDLSASKELERLRREWSEVIAHDFRQPINTIEMFSSTLESFPDLPVTAPEKFRKGVGWIRNSTQQLARLVDDLVDFSRIEANSMKLEKRPVGVCAVLNDVADRLRAQFASRPISVCALHPAPVVSVDPVRMQQVFTNLISNALKYGAPGTPVTIECEQTETALVIAISNEGEGLSSEEINGLFQRFGRTEKALRSTTKGTGLGLYITKGLVEAHGGRIWVESTPGKTTTFFISLPLKDTESGEANAAG